MIQIIKYNTTDSTQIRAKELLKIHKKSPPFCVIADIQTGGYGQAGRQYYCPHGGLYMSLVLPEKDFQYKFAAGFVTVCVADIVLNELKRNERLSIKWINDIIFDGKKISGIIIEKIGNCFVIGIGLNLMQNENVPDYLKDKMGFINTTVPPTEFAEKIIEKITSEKMTDEQVLTQYKKYCNVDGLNLDGSIDVVVDGRKIKKFNNL